MEPNALVEALLSCRQQVVAFTWAIVRDHALAEDIVQEVSMDAVRKHADITDAVHCARWLRRAARFRAIDALRKRRRDVRLLDGQVLDQLESGWGAAGGGAPERLSALRECLRTLTPYTKRLVELRYGSGLSGAALAEALERKLNTVYVALARVHKHLAACVRTRLRGGVDG